MTTYWYDGAEAHPRWDCDILATRKSEGKVVQKRKGSKRGEFVVFAGGISKTIAREHPCGGCPECGRPFGRHRLHCARMGA